MLLAQLNKQNQNYETINPITRPAIEMGYHNTAQAVKYKHGFLRQYVVGTEGSTTLFFSIVDIFLNLQRTIL